MKRVFLMLIAIFCLTGLTSGVAAEVGAPPVYKMDDIVITASRINEARERVSSDITVISREEIRNSASRNVGDLLAEKNLGYIKKYPGSNISIGLRGFRTDTHGNDLQSHVLVLLDGRRSGTGNLAKLMTRNVERIEIIRGPGAVQYGSGGMGGVINIITRKGTDNSLFAEGGGGNRGLADGAVGGTAKYANLDFAGAFSMGTTGDYSDGDGNEFKNTGMDYRMGTSINTGYEFMPGNRLGVVFTHFKVKEAGTPGYLNQNDLDDHAEKKNWSLDFSYTGHDQANRFSWMARGFLGEDDNLWASPTGSNPDGWDDGSESKNYTDQYGVQAQANGKFGPSTVTLGFDWIKYNISNTWDPEESEYENPALFMLSSTTLLEESITLNFGMRYDWYSVDVRKPKGRDEDKSRFTPMAGIAWEALKGLKFRFQYAQGFMMPSAWQLGGYSVNWGTLTRGNPDLDPEKSATFEGGVDYWNAGMDASFTFFSTDFKDRIESVYLSDGSSSWDNMDGASIEGMEIALSYDIGAPLDLSWEIRPYFNMTWLTTYRNDDTDNRLLYISPVNISSGISLADGIRFSGRINVAYTGPQDVEDWESGLWPAPEISMDGFTLVDLTADYRLFETENYGGITWRTEIRNLFDEEYAYVKGYPMPGINFYMGLRWDY